MTSADSDPGCTNVEVQQRSNDYGYDKNFRTALPQIIAVSIKNLLLLGYGMTLGFPTILIPAVQNPKEGEILHLDKTEISWLSSINYIILPLGCALSGVLTSPLGRRRAMQVVNIPYIIAWLIYHFSTTRNHLYGALFLTGLGGGLLEAPVLTYVAEITQPHLRGALAATSSTVIIFGVFTQFLFGIFLYWRTVALVNVSFTILALISLFFVPESPHWLVSRGRVDEARKNLQWLRGWMKSSAVEKELKDIQVLCEEKKEKCQDTKINSLKQTCSLYLGRSFLSPLFLISLSFFVGHFSGMTTLQTYAVSIFQMLEAPLDKYYATLILGLLQIFGSGLCVLLVHYTGKRPLALVSTAGTGICCILVAAYDVHIQMSDRPGSIAYSNFSTGNITLDAVVMKNPHSWMPMTLLMLLALISHTGIRLLPWMLIGEVFSAKTRSGGAGLSGAIGYILGFLTNKLYLTMVDSLSLWGTYGFYGIVCFVGNIILYHILPETEGKKLQDIENHFAGMERLTNKVYHSKRKSPMDVAKMHDIKGNVNPSFEMDCSKL